MTAIDPQQAREEGELVTLLPEKPSPELISAMLAWRSTSFPTGTPSTEDMMRRIYTVMRRHIIDNMTAY